MNDSASHRNVSIDSAFSNLREIGKCNGMAFWMIDRANDDRTEIDDGQKREEKGKESRQIRTFPTPS
jgi:hypothetical protein